MIEKITETVKILLNRHNKSIRRRLLILVLSCSMLSILLLCGIMLYGMFDIRSVAIENSKDIANESISRSGNFLQEQSKATLQGMAHDKARRIEADIEKLKIDVEIVAAETTKIYSQPEEYPVRNINEPNPANGGKVVAQLLFSESVQDKYSPALRQEIAYAANIQDFLVQINYFNKMAVSAYIASKNGFTIMADSSSERKFLNSPNVPDFYEAFDRPWYKQASAANDLIFTDIVEDALGRGPCFICAAPFYRNGEFAGVAGVGSFVRTATEIMKNTKIGNSGFGFILNKDGKIILSAQKYGEIEEGSTADLRNTASETLAAAAKEMTEGKEGIYKALINNKECYIAFAPLKNVQWSFGIIIEADEVVAPIVETRRVISANAADDIDELNGSINQTAFFTIISAFVILIVTAFASKKFSNNFTKPIIDLSDDVREISSGNFDKKIDIRTGDEIEHLAACFNAMTAELKTYMANLTKITAEKERIATELNVAKDIQVGMLPNIFPPYPDRKEFDIYATMNAAKMVGGDFYDLYLLDENHLVITVADVSGKGIPASLFMVISKTVLKNFATFATVPDDYAAVVSCANNQLCQGNEEMMFVTVFFGVLEINTGKFIYVNGGHNPPVIYHAKENTCEFLNVKKNFVLGGMEDVPYQQQEINLANGDLIFVYTDGVNEAMNENHEEYTSERLLEFMNATDCHADLKELLAAVRADVSKHVGDAEQSDDITMLALRRN